MKTLFKSAVVALVFATIALLWMDKEARASLDDASNWR